MLPLVKKKDLKTYKISKCYFFYVRSSLVRRPSSLSLPNSINLITLNILFVSECGPEEEDGGGGQSLDHSPTFLQSPESPPDSNHSEDDQQAETAAVVSGGGDAPAAAEDLTRQRPPSPPLLLPQTTVAGPMVGQFDSHGRIFRPYCLKDPLEYNYTRPFSINTSTTTSSVSSLLQYRNLEDLTTAQAILDLSAPHRTGQHQLPVIVSVPSPPTQVHPAAAAQLQHHQQAFQPAAVVVKHEPPAAVVAAAVPVAAGTVYNQSSSGTSGRTTTAYTYEAFFASDGRSKKPPLTAGGPTAATAALAPGGEVAAEAVSVKPKYTCSECGKHYATSSNLSRHRQTHRALDSGAAKKCPICNKMYVSMPALSMHVLTHNLSHKCEVCGKAFSRPWLLQGHLRSHTGHKPYGCAHCGKSFADRSNLRAHMQTHSAFKNFKCKRCDKSFALKSYLNKHQESACSRDTSSSGQVAAETPPSTPSPSDGDDSDFSGQEDMATDVARVTKVETGDEEEVEATARTHVIHVPKPIFPYSHQLISV